VANALFEPILRCVSRYTATYPSSFTCKSRIPVSTLDEHCTQKCFVGLLVLILLLDGAKVIIVKLHGSDSSPVSERLCIAVTVVDRCIPAAGVDTRQYMRSANRQLLAAPRYRLNTYRHRGPFQLSAPKVWNSLPDFHPRPDHQCRLFQTFA